MRREKDLTEGGDMIEEETAVPHLHCPVNEKQQIHNK
jgi:hypothetical protein